MKSNQDEDVRSLSRIQELEEALKKEKQRSTELDNLLELKMEELSVLHQALMNSNDNLEQAVAERTSELEKTIAKLQMLSKAKSQFVANMSHELRTPLNAIMGCAQVLSGADISHSEVQNLSSQIEASGRRLLIHVERILDYSLLEDKQYNSTNDIYEAKEIVAAATQNFKEMAKAKGLPFTLTQEDDLPARWKGDKKSLLKIMDVIIENAIKYTAAGEVHVHFCKEKHPINNHDVLCIQVKDTGPGLSDDTLAEVFAPFTQVDNSDHRAHGGLGLGLSLASRLANLIGAEIRVESKENEGSLFTIWYPQESKTEVNVEMIESQSASAHVKEIANQLKILAVDDDDGNLLVLRANLAKLGLKCQVAHNGQESLEIISKDPSYNMILMDCQMPVMDGLEATRKLRDMGLRAAVIAVTANSTADNQSICFEAGMNGFISKPFTKEQLAEAIVDSWWFLDETLN